MDLVKIAAIVIFVMTYLFIAVNKTRFYEIKRSYVAVIGALLMLIIGALTLQDAFDSVNFDVIFLLLGMMTLVAGLEYAGFFTLVSNFLVEHSQNKIRLLILIMAISAFLSAAVLNDAVVLMFTPIVIRCCIRLNVNPMPYLIGLMFSANIGSIATPIGNPQNAYIISITGIDFIEYLKYCIPIAIVCLIIAFFVIFLFYGKRMGEECDIHPDTSEDMEIKKIPLCLMILITVASFVFFILTGSFDFKICHVALVAGALSLLVVLFCRPADGIWVAKKVDWHILAFFIGLFILIGGASKTGMISDIASSFPGFDNGNNVYVLTLLSVVLSNLVSNVPAVMLIAEMMPAAGLTSWITLAVSSTLAGNTTLIGSAANIIVAERAMKYGVRIDFIKFMGIGITVTVFTVLAMIGMIQLMLIN